MKKLFSTFMLVMCTFCAWAYDAEVDGIYYNLNADSKEATVTYKNGDYNSYSGDVVIPDSIVYNDVYFAVTSIGSNAFQWCADLTSITIGNSVESINDFAFNGCYGLKSLVISNSVKTIASGAFKNCSGLTSVTMGNSVESIGSYAFDCCEFVKTLIYADGCKSTIETRLQSITSVTIPSSVTRIGDRTFQYCYQLTSVEIPDSVERIGESAFYGCFGLSSIKIPSSVASIGSYAFGNCSGFKYVENCSATPQSIVADVFQYVEVSKILLYVPEESIDDYNTAEVWKDFIVVSGDPTCIETHSAGIGQTKRQKRVENGRVVITLPDGKKYATDGKQL